MMETTKLPKMHYACVNDELRPVMNYVLVTKTDVVATDGHILALHKTEDLFGQEFIDEMPERILIHAENWKILSKGFQTIYYDKDKECIVLVSKGISYLISVEYEKNIFEYPKYNEILSKLKPKDVNCIGIKYQYLYYLGKALGSDNLQLKFNGVENGVLVQTEYAKGLIMPCIIDF